MNNKSKFGGITIKIYNWSFNIMMNIFYLNRIVFLGAILFSFLGCQSDVVFEENNSIDKQWPFDKGVSFQFEIEDTLARYDLLLNINHKEDFKYQNIYCEISMAYPQDETKKDIISLELSSRPGLWDADCSGGDCDLEVLLQKSARFPKLGLYTLSLNQHSRDSLLQGVNGIGLVVKKVVKK